MKKVIAILSAFIIMLGAIPVSAYTMIDYSSYVGTWTWDNANVTEDSYNPLNWTNFTISSCNGDSCSFTLQSGQFAVTIKNASMQDGKVFTEYYDKYDEVVWGGYEVWGNIALTFYETGIWMEWNAYETNAPDGSYRSGFFVNSKFVPVYIEQTNIPVLLNGMPIEFDQQPVMVNDRVLVPMRRIFELLNADVYYDSGTHREEDGRRTGQRITAVKSTWSESKKVVLDEYNGKWTMRTMGANHSPAENYAKAELYAQPIILYGRTMLPIRAISNAFGVKAEWDVENSRVVITGDISGKRKSDEEISKIQSFTYDEAKKIVQAKRYFKKGFFAPEYDEKGKFYRFLVSDDGTKDGKEINAYVYYDGTIEQK